MAGDALLATLPPIRDRRERVVGYLLNTCPATERRGADAGADEARRTVEMVSSLSRLCGKSLVVPVTPTLVRDGALSRFASADAVWLLSTDALEDAPTRKSVDRLLGAGFDFALDGFPEGAPLLPSLVGATILIDAQRISALQLESRIRTLLDAGLRPLVRGVDDRAMRHRVIAAGAPLHTGRLLTRAASTLVDRQAEAGVLRAIAMLAAFADGRPANDAFDDYVRDDPHLAASLLRSMRSATMGVRGPKSVAHALTMLGRDAVMEQLVTVAALLIGETAHDPELALIALRRARVCDQVGAALDPAPHPRARALAGLLSVLEFALGVPPSVLLSRLNLPSLLGDALLDRRERLGQLLDVVDAMEYGWWDDLRARCGKLGIAPSIVSDAWLASWRSAREALGFARADTT